jgi:ADP-ribose pyrophosphatase
VTRILPETPKVELEVVTDRTAKTDDRGFLAIRSVDLVAIRGDGTQSARFPYDVLERRAIDAAIMVAHHVVGGRVHVYLRSAVRPPLALRPHAPMSPNVWEIPAGLIEPDEEPVAAAVRELEEELGFAVSVEDMKPLGPAALPAPGFIGELHFYFHVRVDPRARREPKGDGSPLEQDARIESVALEDALEACRQGEVPDSKTELTLRRLAEALGGTRT